MKDLIQRLNSMKRSNDPREAFRIAGTVETNERYRTFVRRFITTIPTSKYIRSARPRRLRSVGVFVAGLVLATCEVKEEEGIQTKSAACDMLNVLKKLMKSTSSTSLRVLNFRIELFNEKRLRYMNELHKWRKDFENNFLEEITPIYVQLLLLRSSKDPSGAVKRLNTLLDNITRVVGREEARQFDLERRREAAGMLASMLGEESSVVTTEQTSSIAAKNVRIGSRVMLRKLGRGVVRFLGETKFGTGGVWAGVELNLPVGRNDGSVRGEQYFHCADGHGVFVRPKSLFHDDDVDVVKTKKFKEEEDEVVADDECDDEEDSSSSMKRRKSHTNRTTTTTTTTTTTKRIPSPWTIRPPSPSPKPTTSNSSSSSTQQKQRPAWLSSGISGGATSSDGREMNSDSESSNRRRRQSMARQLASLVSQRIRTIAKRYDEKSLVHELILNENFSLKPPEKSQVNTGLENLRGALLRGEWKTCIHPVREVSNELVALSGRGNNILTELRNIFVSSLKKLLEEDINRKNSKVFFQSAGRLLMKLQSPAYDEETRAFIEGFDKSMDDDDADTFVDALCFLARHIVVIRVESMNHIIRTKLRPLLQGRGAVDFERREVASLIKAGTLNLDPNGSSEEIHQWLRENVDDWCKHSCCTDFGSEKKRLRSLLLQDAKGLESFAIWAFLDLVLPRTPTRPIPPTLSMDSARILLLRNKFTGMIL